MLIRRWIQSLAVRRTVWSVMVICCICASGWAQVITTATLNGTVTDASGAAIPAANVTATNENTGITASTTSNPDGTFVFPGMRTGQYCVTVSKEGFETYVESGLILHPAIVSTVNAVLKVGATVSKVTVVASANQVQTTTGEMSSDVNSQQVSQLPLNGQNFVSLENLLPGATNGSPGIAFTQIQMDQVEKTSLNGLGWRGADIFIDGIMNMDLGDDFTMTFMPSPDALQEVRVMQNNYGVQYSFSGGTAVLVQTKSGTNTFHGTLYDYLENTDLNARNPFSSSVPGIQQNQFGGSIGGPVYIPGHGRASAKTFFFVSNIDLIQNIASTVLGMTADAAERSGNFAELCTAGFNAGICTKSSQQLTNPANGLPFLNNMITSPLNSNSLALINTLANLPNNPGGGAQNFINLIPAYKRAVDNEFKVDHDFSQKNRLTAEYFDELSAENNPDDSYVSKSPFTALKSSEDTKEQAGAIRFTATLSPTMTNTAEIAISKERFVLAPHGIYQVSGVSGFSENLPYKDGFFATILPSITFSSGGYSTFGGDFNLIGTWPTLQRHQSFDDDWSWLRGKHYIVAGFNFFKGRENEVNPGTGLNGTWAFSGNFTGNAMADYLLGLPASFSQVSGEPNTRTIFAVESPYIQDPWKAMRRVTTSAVTINPKAHSPASSS